MLPCQPQRQQKKKKLPFEKQIIVQLIHLYIKLRISIFVIQLAHIEGKKKVFFLFPEKKNK